MEGNRDKTGAAQARGRNTVRIDTVVYTVQTVAQGQKVKVGGHDPIDRDQDWANGVTRPSGSTQVMLNVRQHQGHP